MKFFFKKLLLTPITALFPYTTLFRSVAGQGEQAVQPVPQQRRQRAAGAGVRADVGKQQPAHAIAPFAGLLGLLAFRSEEHTSELQSRRDLVCRLLLEKKNLLYRKVRL